jgi:hypothetical protein
LEQRAEQVWPGSEGWGEREKVGQRVEMSQTMFAHMNKGRNTPKKMKAQKKKKENVIHCRYNLCIYK